tara:strand:+ start:1286 stop:1777 length:492 start_codon:yes stop_codon:yes gene_type:complete
MGEFEYIKDYETYLINKEGVIKDNRTGKIKPQYINKDGYKRIHLVNHSGTKCFSVHRLVGIQFLENDKKLPEIDHIDRNKLNNNVNNLRWADDYIQARNKGDFKNNKLKEKHIHHEEDSNTSRYVFQITHNGIRHKKSFNTKLNYSLEDAIKYKNEYYKKFNL